MVVRRLRQPSSCAACVRPPVMIISTRGVVQANNNGGLRSVLDMYPDSLKVQTLNKNGRGNFYRYQRKLWPSAEALEKDLTAITYSTVERTPLALLPQRSPPTQRTMLEGRGAVALLEREMNAEEQVVMEEDRPSTRTVDDDDDVLEELLTMDHAVTNKMLSEEDLEGSILASARFRARQRIHDDLSVNTLATSSSTSLTSSSSTAVDAVGLRRRAPSQTATDEGGASWSSLGLDPVVAHIATTQWGPTPTRLQTRLLPSLLNEDHNDVLMNGVTGSGKTSSLLLTMLQGIRQESAGMNVLVATNSITAMRLHDRLRAMCSAAVGGGEVLDRPAHDFSWLVLGTYREDAGDYVQLLRKGLRGPHGPARIFITTADTFCEMLFLHKMEFEDFGYLRRVYVDDVGTQLPMIAENAPTKDVRERLRNPLAIELLLGTLHQLPGPHIRSILQLGLVSADVEGSLQKHLHALCIKPHAHTTILSPVRVPSTLHCLFSFMVPQPQQSIYTYASRLIWNARSTIPGRAILFIREDEDILAVRMELRRCGMDARLFSEVYGDGGFHDAQDNNNNNTNNKDAQWKFMLLKPSEAFAVDLPLVSHVFILFAPTSWQEYLHMAGRAGRLGEVGWVYTIADRRDAKPIADTMRAIDVDVLHHVMREDLTQEDPAKVHGWIKDPELYGLDPQYAVQQHYEVQAENPDVANRSREFFSKPVKQQFLMEDYTPINIKQRSMKNATKLSRDIERDPSLVVEMQRQGLLNAHYKPTKRLRSHMKRKSSKLAPAPFKGQVQRGGRR